MLALITLWKERAQLASPSVVDTPRPSPLRRLGEHAWKCCKALAKRERIALGKAALVLAQNSRRSSDRIVPKCRGQVPWILRLMA